MLRNSVMYRRLWYIRRRNSARFAIFVKRLILFVVLAAIMFYSNQMLYPQLIIMGEASARTEVTRQISLVVNDVIMQGMQYDSIVELKKSRDGSISAISVNSVVLNKICASLSEKLSEALSELEKEKIEIPVGSILGNTIFSGMGPGLPIKIKPIADINTSYGSNFTEAGINQTKHSIFLDIIINIRLSAPLSQKNMVIENVVPLAETIIVGKVPFSAFLDIEVDQQASH